jgi:predicted AlkP superfamily pyrophosphatase or phosphodiesterase
MAYDQSFPPDRRVDQVLSWLELPEDRRPSFLTLYFDAVDEAGHHDGPNSAGLDAALAATDAALGRLVEGLKARGLYDRTNLIVTGDHGMADVSASRVIYLDDLVRADAVHLVTSGTSSGLSIAPGAPKDTLKTLLALRDHARCYRKADLPKDLRYGRNPRVPPVFCLADVGWFISTHDREQARKTPFDKGAHGYPPDTPEMAVGFVAEGPAFRKGATLAPFDNVDVEPLMAALLGLKGPKADGTAATFRPVLLQH